MKSMENDDKIVVVSCAIMKKVLLAIVTSLFMGFIGMVIGVFFDETFGGASFIVTPVLSIIFVIITMGAFIIHSIESKK